MKWKIEAAYQEDLPHSEIFRPNLSRKIMENCYSGDYKNGVDKAVGQIL